MGQEQSKFWGEDSQGRDRQAGKEQVWTLGGPEARCECGSDMVLPRGGWSSAAGWGPLNGKGGAVSPPLGDPWAAGGVKQAAKGSDHVARAWG